MEQSDLQSEPRQWISLPRAELIEHAIRRGEGVLSRTGALVVDTITPEDNFSADRYVVDEASTEDVIDWQTNEAFQADTFDALWERAEAFAANSDRYTQFVHVGDDPQYYLPIKVVTQTPWQSLSALNLFSSADEYNPKAKGEWQILNVPDFVCQPERDGTLGDRAVVIHFARRRVLLAGMHNGGEMKKAMFTVLSFLLPEREVLPLHSAASLGVNDKVTLLLGASGSGKTTLATGPSHQVIGDDEIGWGKTDLFNLEGGFYLRTDQLKEAEASDWLSPVRFGAVIENAGLTEARALDFDAEQTLNAGRCAYPFAYTRRAPMSMMDAKPDYLVLLCRDYFGVLPSVSKLSVEQAAYFYLCGYSSTLESNGGSVQPKALFRTCFTAPYLPRPAQEYAELLVKRIEQAQTQVYLFNTGVLGDVRNGAERIPVAESQTLLQMLQTGELDEANYHQLPELGLEVPESLPGFANNWAEPSSHWADKAAFAQAQEQLKNLFIQRAEQLELPESLQQAGFR